MGELLLLYQSQPPHRCNDMCLCHPSDHAVPGAARAGGSRILMMFGCDSRAVDSPVLMLMLIASVKVNKGESAFHFTQHGLKSTLTDFATC